MAGAKGKGKKSGIRIRLGYVGLVYGKVSLGKGQVRLGKDKGKGKGRGCCNPYSYTVLQ